MTFGFADAQGNFGEPEQTPASTPNEPTLVWSHKLSAESSINKNFTNRKVR